VLGIAAQDYFGFGVHWGPRALLPGLPAFVALFWVALREGAGAGRAPAVALALAGTLSSGVSLWLLAEQKAEGARLQQAVLARPTDLLISTHPYLAQQLPALWRERAVVAVDRPETLQAVVANVAQRGGGRVQWVVPAGSAGISVPGLRCDLEHAHRGARLHYLDLDVYGCRVAPLGPAR